MKYLGHFSVDWAKIGKGKRKVMRKYLDSW